MKGLVNLQIIVSKCISNLFTLILVNVWRLTDLFFIRKLKIWKDVRFNVTI